MLKRKIIKTLLRYRRLISNHMNEHKVFKSTQYVDRDSILAKTIAKDQKEIEVVDKLIKEIKNENHI
ncbi:hypothetical protein LCGC14_1881710 [marine sediment metagenome]|uniref:Uncharacterized protein n=1 Tax=marine sediment metagenome TaxID=412755 RepID=A0A0F9IG57_9ZZZZ